MRYLYFNFFGELVLELWDGDGVTDSTLWEGGEV